MSLKVLANTEGGVKWAHCAMHSWHARACVVSACIWLSDFGSVPSYKPSLLEQTLCLFATWWNGSGWIQAWSLTTNWFPFVLWHVGLVIWPIEIVSEMTYYVSSGTLNPTHSLTRKCGMVMCLVESVCLSICLYSNVWKPWPRNFIFGMHFRYICSISGSFHMSQLAQLLTKYTHMRLVHLRLTGNLVAVIFSTAFISFL